MRRMLCTLMAAALVVAGCGGGDSGSGARQERFRVGTAAAVESLNPLTATTAASEGIVNLTYPRLVQYDARQTTLVDDFATSWEIAADGRTITFQTHTGKWSDGKPLTARDAAWSINLYVEHKAGATGAYSDFVEGVARAEAPDDRTLVVHYDEPRANPLARLQRATILPRHVWEPHVTGKDAAGLLEFAPKPPVVSGGPFVVERFDPDGGVVLLERNPDFYGPRPSVNVLGFQAYTSPDALIAALRNGEIDAIDSLPTNTPLAPLERAGAQIGRVPGGAMDWIILNSNGDKPKHRELLDAQVRLALDHAIDRAEIVRTALQGNGFPGTAFLPNSNAFHDAALKAPEFDLEEANRLLDEAGYERGNDGIRVADGEKMSYTVYSAPTSNARAFQIVQDAWREIGVAVRRRALDVPALVEAISAPDGKGLDYDIAIWGYNAQPDPSPMLSLPTCAQRGIFNEPYYCNREYDRLYAQQASELDEDARKRIVARMQRILAEDRPYLLMNSQMAISVLGRGWTGPTMTPSGYFQTRFSKIPLTTVKRAAG